MKKGKEICYEMKKLRANIAEEYGIEGFEFKECDFEGECEGYCPACDDEVMRLRELVQEIKDKKFIEDLEKNGDIPKDILTGKIKPIKEVTMGVVIPNFPEDRKEKDFSGKVKFDSKSNNHEEELPTDALGGLRKVEPRCEDDVILLGDVSVNYFDDKIVKDKEKKGIRGIFRKKDNK